MFKLCKMTIRAGFVVLIALAMVFASSYAPSQVLAATAPSLGAAESFGVLGGQAVTNTGYSVITGDLGIYPKDASSITGFPPGSYTGALHAADGVALQAQTDVTAAYINLAGQTPYVDLTGTDLGGRTLVPGVYHFDTSAGLTGTLTLDAQNSTTSMFIFQIGSTLTTASGSSVVVINVPPEGLCNIYWQVGSSATLDTDTTFTGNILALDSITLKTGASLYGRALARNAAVTMDNNQITIPVCGVGPLPGTLEIFTFNDLNGNGVEDQPGETPLANWHYTITGPGGYSSSGDTDEAGLIVKTGLVSGDYNVTETAQADWIVTTDNPQIGMVPAGGGKRLNFGNRELMPPETRGTLEIFKFNDLNGDGIYEPGAPDFETPLESWNFTVAGGPTPTPGPYSTDVNGLITISNLTAGDYTVTETVSLNWTVTTANPQTGTVPAGAGIRLNFGNVEGVPMSPGTLEIFKFNDLDGNGVYDPSEETPLANWYYTITGPGGYSSYGTTNASGLIIKTGLAPGDYNVTETAQLGWTVTTANPQTGTVSDSVGKRLNFGNRQPGILQVFKFNDLNGNGVYDPPEETPLANWHYTIAGPGGYSSSGDTDNLGLLTKTSLGGLVPGDYIVTETVQAGWTITTANPQTEMVPAGVGKRLDFGNRQPVPSVGGEAYPINKVKLLMPWIVLAAAIIAGATIFLRRRRAQS
jgi:hypothetical protein